MTKQTILDEILADKLKIPMNVTKTVAIQATLKALSETPKARTAIMNTLAAIYAEHFAERLEESMAKELGKRMAKRMAESILGK